MGKEQLGFIDGDEQIRVIDAVAAALESLENGDPEQDGVRVISCMISVLIRSLKGSVTKEGLKQFLEAAVENSHRGDTPDKPLH